MVMYDCFSADHSVWWHTCSFGHGGAQIQPATFESSKLEDRRQRVTDLWSYGSAFVKEREEEAVSVEANGHFPLACVSAEGLAVKLRMKVLHLNASKHNNVLMHITFLFWDVSKITIQELRQQNRCPISVLLYWLMSGRMKSRPSLECVWVRHHSRVLLCSHLTTQMGP